MRVVYKKTILEKMDEEIIQSMELNKKIEKIILSQEEWQELYDELKPICPYLNDGVTKPGEGYKTIYRGIPIFIE